MAKDFPTSSDDTFNAYHPGSGMAFPQRFTKVVPRVPASQSEYEEPPAPLTPNPSGE